MILRDENAPIVDLKEQVQREQQEKKKQEKAAQAEKKGG